MTTQMGPRNNGPQLPALVTSLLVTGPRQSSPQSPPSILALKRRSPSPLKRDGQGRTARYGQTWLFDIGFRPNGKLSFAVIQDSSLHRDLARLMRSKGNKGRQPPGNGKLARDLNITCLKTNDNYLAVSSRRMSSAVIPYAICVAAALISIRHCCCKM